MNSQRDVMDEKLFAYSQIIKFTEQPVRLVKLGWNLMSLVSHSCKFSNIQVYIRNNENNISDEVEYIYFLAGWKHKEGQK